MIKANIKNLWNKHRSNFLFSLGISLMLLCNIPLIFAYDWFWSPFIYIGMFITGIYMCLFSKRKIK